MGCAAQAFYSRDTRLPQSRIQQLQPPLTGIYGKEVTPLLLNIRGKQGTGLASPFTQKIRRFCRATTGFELLLCCSLISVQIKSRGLQKAALPEPQLKHNLSCGSFESPFFHIKTNPKV